MFTHSELEALETLVLREIRKEDRRSEKRGFALGIQEFKTIRLQEILSKIKKARSDETAQPEQRRNTQQTLSSHRESSSAPSQGRAPVR